MSTRSTASIYHHPDAIESDDTPLAGRRTAGQSFLRGYARHAQTETIHCAAGSDAHIQHFRTFMAENGWTGPIEGTLTHEPAKLSRPGCLFLPGPSLAAHAWPRRRVGQNTYSLCGITHTVATRRMMETIHDCLTGPVEPWDAIICTSHAVRAVVAIEMDHTETYLRRRFAARRVPRPQLPIIPLGIEASAFRRDPALRSDWRARYGLDDDDILVMSMGRLNTFEKQHPLPLCLALERAAQETGRKITLLMVGWFGDDGNEKLHRNCAAFAPSITVDFPDGRDATLRYQIWSAADIFALPVDNIQETFGLAPVEAMAAGLPVVCSDWNGFKDTVEDGVTGIRVKTLMAPPGIGDGIAERFEEQRDGYLQYLGSVQHRTVVDIPEMAAAFSALIKDAGLRDRMGSAGLDRVARLYDWSAVIPQYQALWRDLAERRAAGIASSEREVGEPANPRAIDPFQLYAGYPTDRIGRGARFTAQRHADSAMIERYLDGSGARMLRRLPASVQQLDGVLRIIIDRGPLNFVEMAALAPKVPERVLVNAVLWLAKYDLIVIET